MPARFYIESWLDNGWFVGEKDGASGKKMVTTLHNIVVIATVALLQPPLYIVLHSITISLYNTIITYIVPPAHDIVPHNIIVQKSGFYM